MVKYGGFRWIRGGIEGLSDNGPTTLQTPRTAPEDGRPLQLGLVSGNSDLKKLIESARCRQG